MVNFIIKTVSGRKSWKITTILIITLLFIVPVLKNPIRDNNIKNYQQHQSEYNLGNSNSESYLFNGNLNSINITDYGNLYENNQEVTLTNQEEMNLTYYLDDVHEWKISKIQNSMQNIQDSRDWVNDSNFEYFNFTVFTEIESHDTFPHYSSDETKETSLLNISKPGALAIRVYFESVEFELDYDFIFIEDKYNTLYYHDTGSRYDFYSPWIKGDTAQIYMVTDDSVTNNGYEISSFQYINGSIDFELWGFYNESFTQTNYGYGIIENATAMYVTLLSDRYWSGVAEGYYAEYNKYDFAEVYQNLTIPRAAVLDAFISFDYYAEFAIESNDFYYYIKINDEEIFSLGLGDVVDAGRNQWHSTGDINIDLWLNNSIIFENIINKQKINISVGIKSRSSALYSGYIDRYQQLIWFDNLTLNLKCIANSSQNGISLKVNGYDLIEGEQWGESYLNLTGNWENNPISLTISTSSPSLTFEMDTVLFGYHATASRIGQSTIEGIDYHILDNGSIYCEFYHNLYMPPLYSDFEFIIDKPINWEVITILDPTFLSIPFEGGNIGDNYIKINKTHAIFPGWWKFKAILPNYILDKNTFISKNGQWDAMEFYTGDFGKIKTQINYSDDIPTGLDQTVVNLTIYNPQGDIWYEEVKVPESNGTVIFPEFSFSSLNTSGGIYNFTLFWNNGTSLGGLKSYFTVIHESYITLLKPDDAKEDLITGGSVGDIIPLRVFVRDFENNYTLSDAIVTFNWSSGTRYMTQAALGIYEDVLDTGDLGALGLYTIIIKMNKTGYKISNITLSINLGEETILQRLDSESHIVLNANSTIRFYYYADFDEEGIPGAYVTVNISNPSYYTVHDLSDGYYEIEFSTVFIDIPGIYILEFGFSAPGYEEQLHLYQFNIINPTPDNNESNILFWVILFAATVIIGVLGALSLRSYIILPRKRKKESELLARTQRFKDLSNIQAIVVINRISGIPLFSQSYSILEKHKKELFSGFIQAITTIGEEIVGKDLNSEEGESKSKIQTKERILELDFKYFYCLVFDKEDLRIVFVLKEKASQRLKEQIMHLSLGLTLQLSEHIENWDGSLDQFEDLVPPIINDYIELYYKEPFIINKPVPVAKLRKESELSTMETRILNVIYSIAKNKSEFHLDFIIESVHEHNKDKTIDALESLIQKKIIIPKTN